MSGQQENYRAKIAELRRRLTTSGETVAVDNKGRLHEPSELKDVSPPQEKVLFKPQRWF